MSETLYTGLTIDVRRIPESSLEPDGQGGQVQIELPGYLQYGVNLDGHFKVLFQEKAPGTLADVERVKQANPPPPQTAPPEQAPPAPPAPPAV
jgi:hypothetical protein